MPYKLFLIILCFWLLLTYNFTLANTIIGFLACVIIVLLTKGILYNKNGYLYRKIDIFIFLKYVTTLLVEIYKSSFSYIVRIVKKDCEPYIVDIELDVTDPLIISLISNSITLTPGTLTVDVQGSKLTVLTLQECKNPKSTVEKEIKEKFQIFFIEKG